MQWWIFCGLSHSFWGNNLGKTRFLWWRPRLYLSCSFSSACCPTFHLSLHQGTSGSAFYRDNQQRFKLGMKPEHEGQPDKNVRAREREHERGENKTEMEDRARQRGIYEVRGADIWTDTVQQTGSYEDIWRIHEAVMNLFDFVYRSARVSLMDKVGAGKHISVMARHCRKNKLNSLLAFHTLSTPFSLSPTITHFLPLWFSIFVFLSSPSFFVLPSLSFSPSVLLLSLSLSFHPFLGLSLFSFSLCASKMKNRAICVGTASRIELLMFLLRQLRISATLVLPRTCGQLERAEQQQGGCFLAACTVMRLGV